MSQQNIYPADHDEAMQIQNKVILLYLIDKMDIPLPNSQITQFAIEEELMSYFSVQQYLADMVKSNYLEQTIDNNSTRYTITDEGTQTLDFFIKHITPIIKDKILKYISVHRKIVKQDYQITANHFFDQEVSEYLIKCAVSDDEMMLLEMKLYVVSKEQAVSICNNWKSNIDVIYRQVLGILLDEDQKVVTERYYDGENREFHVE